jgi:nucleotide-binding universal stress UspA family protein
MGERTSGGRIRRGRVVVQIRKGEATGTSFKEAKMYKKILVPLDGSELAECALNHVRQLFKDRPGGQLILLNAVVTEVPWRDINPGETGRVEVFDYNAYRKTFMDHSTKYLAKVESRLSSEGIKVQTESIESNGPSHTINDYAQKNGVDLIVIATHGYTGMKKMMLGSTALKVLHESNVPVLLIRPEACHI